ncbi:hypothetical protein C5B42_05435 [Candidatus Cerribacteria bacterium 'Amazon FNV 2010 28 9']|uniref:Uncharacterized protein n=1 Tax=Candidatus Cerribacteria bacterium 'Amazon FNV 2010 28 9' TaxID=2081795 RepID=A0A317JRD2_9BACT|nr:MAG: hypothetical protein C5B42_05435 [Candidatus Cerribacteria bacterium 'Amazon FNV 2010 28 9']
MAQERPSLIHEELAQQIHKVLQYYPNTDFANLPTDVLIDVFRKCTTTQEKLLVHFIFMGASADVFAISEIIKILDGTSTLDSDMVLRALVEGSQIRYRS